MSTVFIFQYVFLTDTICTNKYDMNNALFKEVQIRLEETLFFSIGRGVATLIYYKRFIVATLVTSRTADSRKLCYLGCSLHSGGLVSGPAGTKSYPGII